MSDDEAFEPIPRDAHGNEAYGICMNCGSAMVEDPMHPWCAECDEAEE